MPAVDHPLGVAASLPGQLADLQKRVKDLSVNKTQSPNILTVGVGGLTVLGPSSLDGPLTLGAGIDGPVAAHGPLSGDSLDVTGAISGASSSVTGAASSDSVNTGSVTASGSSAFGPINCTYARGHTVLSGYANAYWDGNGDAGVNVSSVVYKQDIAPADLSEEVQAILRMALVRFRYITAVEEYGDDAPVELGSLAEYVESIGLGEYVFYGQDGKVQGIAYERLTIPLIATVQSLDARLKALEAAA